MIDIRTKTPQTLLGLLATLLVMLALPAAGALFALTACAEEEKPTDEPTEEGTEEAPEGDEPTGETEDAPELPWLDDVAAAKKQAKAEGKDLFINFTGSDWCRYCIMLDDEVFEHAEFIESATKDFVFLFLDFPNDPSLKAKVVDAELNDDLKNAYSVGGFPTIVLTTADGHPYGRAGYQPGGPALFLEKLAELKTAGEKVKKLIADETHEDVETLKAAFPVLAENEFLGYEAYDWTLGVIEKLDPKGELELLPFVETERARRLASEEEKGLIALFPKSREEQPDREAIANYVIATEHMSGGQFLNMCFGLANWMLTQGDNPELAKKLLERAAKDPLAQEHPQAKQALAELMAKVEEALNPPVDEDEGKDHEDGDEDEEHDDDGDGGDDDDMK